MTTHTSTLVPYGALLQRWLGLFGAQGKDIRRAAVRSAIDEAASVRALADTYRRSDPSFASDLYAAADRHDDRNVERAGLWSRPSFRKWFPRCVSRTKKSSGRCWH